MRLKRLEILGFKSFADKIKLEFDVGITAIVGPNGCGKSNIADAFRWVLGEQSAKSMRGAKMPDVIFAGTSHRKPLNFAEVTLTLTDVGDRLPLQYDEVAVTRRLYRSGESEYFINRHPVRLKDVQALFLDSGMGKDAYSIFEQGKIDQVINLSPLERRYIFEEAAGILRFLQRKKEALRKLEQTDLNVARVKDIHCEVEKQIIVLEEQAEKARQFKEDKQTLDKLEKTFLLMKWDSHQSRLIEIKKKAEGQQEKITVANEQADALVTQLSEAKQAAAEAEKALRQRSEEVFSMRSTKELTSKEKQSSQDRLRDLVSKEKRWQSELEAMNERRRQREEERKALLASQKETEARFKTLEETVKTQRDKVKLLEEDLLKQRNQHQSKQNEVLKLLQIENQHESEIRQVSVRLENAHERQTQVQERKERLAKAMRDLRQQAEEKKQLLENAAHLLEEHKKVFEAVESDLQRMAQETNKTQEAMDRIHAEIAECKARHKVLQGLREELEGYSAGGKKLIKEAAKKGSPLFGKVKGLYEYLVPEKGTETALAVVMRSYAQTLVVETEADFAAVAAYAKQHQIKDISLFCLETVQKESGLKINSSLSPFIKHVAKSKIADHFLQGTYLCKEVLNPLEVLKDSQGNEICLGDSVFVDRRSVIFYAAPGENNVFLREAELKTLGKKLHDQEQRKQEIEQVLQELKLKRNQLNTKRVEVDKAIRQTEMKLVELNFAVQKTAADLDKMDAEDRLLTKDWETAAKTIESLTLALSELNQKHSTAKEIAAQARKHTEQLSAELDKQITAVKIQAGGLREKENALQSTIDEQRKQAHALHVLEIKDLESTQQEKRLEDEIEMGRASQGQIELKKAEVDKILEEAEHSLAHAVAACTELEEQVTVRKNALEHLESKINEKRLLIKKYEAEHNQANIQMAQFESNSQSVENELQERHQLAVEQARTECGPISEPVEKIEKQVKALRQQIEGIGDINMTSIEECEKHKARYQFLNQQLDDLNLSKQELVAIIAELDGESRKIFQEAFKKIRANFKKNFEILFNGGEADLQFTESADVLEAGIEIIAKPPGKQMRSINLLSGGEKCLTALALLFAIFEVKPAPFCILDEIDAPLDDTNVGRFVNIVKQFVDCCQFIIITHNKRTMAIADVIFGVSMEEKGVSKLLSMDFAKSTAPAVV